MFYPTWDKSFSQHSQRCIVFGWVKAPDRNIALLLKCLRKTPCLIFFKHHLQMCFSQFPMICSSSILNFPGKLWNLPGNFPRFPTDQFLFHQGMPARRSTKATCCTVAFCTVHAGSTTRCCHTCEKALLDVLGEEGNSGTQILMAEMVILYHQKWGFHQENGD